MASSVDEGVFGAGQMPPNQITDGVVDDRGRDSLHDLHRQPNRPQGLRGERCVEEHIPQVASCALVVEELLSTGGRPARLRSPGD